MMNYEYPNLTVAVVSFNGMDVIGTCLDSVFAQKYKLSKVLLIDNASSDGTPEWVKNHYPQVEIVRYPINNGPNPARNLGIQSSSDDLVLLMDDDAVLEPSCIAQLINAYNSHSDGAIWAPKILYYDDKDKIQMDLIFLHYLSEAILPNGNKLLQDGLNDISPTGSVSGIALLVSKKAAENIGGFDEDYFFGRTDGEFSFRLRLAGYKLYCVPEALCYHRFKERGLSKVWYQIRNRWYLTLSAYSIKTLLLCFPAFLVYEILMVGFLFRVGKTGVYLSAIREVVYNYRKIIRKRKIIQSTRKVSDKEVLKCGPINMRADLIKNPTLLLFKASLDYFFCLYWRIIRRAL